MSTVFTLEAVFAKHGDCLILHYGPWSDPLRVLIDGGPRGVYGGYLGPRLEQLREDFEILPDESIPFEMVMVSHIDADHITGIIDLFETVAEAREEQKPLPVKTGRLWHNSFDDILGNTEPLTLARMVATAVSNQPDDLSLPKMNRSARAVVASTAQGITLRELARKLQIEANPEFDRLVVDRNQDPINMGNGLTFRVIGPDEERVKKYQEEWDEDLEKIKEKEEDSATALAFSDNSPFNLASICVLAEMEEKRMLLTGDARGDYVLEGLERAGLLPEGGTLKVDLLKLPHHGSSENVREDFFQKILADHYVVSGDGLYGNPEPEVLEMIQAARGDDRYKIHFTVTADARETETSKTRKKALEKVHDWIAQKPANCEVVFRSGEEDTLSVLVDLLDPLYED